MASIPRQVQTKLPGNAGMQGGFGDDNYFNNSRGQNYGFHAYAKSHLAEAIHQCVLFNEPSSRTFRIADFGCSNGRNTLECAEFIAGRVRERNTICASEIQYFFSDLPSNDFNGLFQLWNRSTKETGDQELPLFYAAGVPGSFHTRLFPAASLDLAICINSLHWLSQIPPAVLDRTSPVWNGGHIWIHGQRPKVAEAYAEQFQADVKRFLNCRAQELAKGALLFLNSPTRSAEHPTGDYFERFDDFWNGSFESTWDELVSEGVVDAEERDMFNVPHYNFHRSEIEAAVKDVPELELIGLEVTEDKASLPETELEEILNDPKRLANFVVGNLKAVMKPMMQMHIGEERTGEFFERMQTKVLLKASNIKHLNVDVMIAVLRRW